MFLLNYSIGNFQGYQKIEILIDPIIYPIGFQAQKFGTDCILDRMIVDRESE